MSPVTGHDTAFHVTPLVGSAVEPFCPRPSATAAPRLRSMWLVLPPHVAHSSTIVAVTVLPMYVTSTHMPQYAPLPNSPLWGKAAKYWVPVFATVSVMPVGQ